MTHRWVVIRSKPRKEEFLAQQMELRRIKIFNPGIQVPDGKPTGEKDQALLSGIRVCAYGFGEGWQVFSAVHTGGLLAWLPSEGKRPMCRMG